MIFNEEKGNLFDLSKDEYVFAHCIAADLCWGGGIAPILIKKEFDAEDICRYKEDGGLVSEPLQVGKAMYVKSPKGRFFNLITKEFTHDLPTYDTVRASLNDMKATCNIYHINKIAMPRIASGLDRLEWPKVADIIKEVFEDTDIEIQIRYI